jgi:hypothetical protein
LTIVINLSNDLPFPSQSGKAAVLKFSDGDLNASVTSLDKNGDVTFKYSGIYDQSSEIFRITTLTINSSLGRIECNQINESIKFSANATSVDLESFWSVITSENDVFQLANGRNVLSAGMGDDYVLGGTNTDIVNCGFGDDIFNGESGLDTSIYSGSLSQYQIKSGVNSFVITDQTNSRDGTDTLINVERLKFTDTNIALDVGPTENAGSVYMLYKAAFNRAPDNSGMGYWLAQKDGGSNIVTNIAQGFVNAPEFVAKYGTNPSNASYVDKLYQNVLGRQGEAGGVAYWNQELNAGNISKAAVLVQFATLPEGAANVASLIANGIPYTEYVG